MQLVWAENVLRKTNKPVLIVTPLAVGAQTIREGTKFGIEVDKADPKRIGKCIYVTNYERLHHLDPALFGAAVADESGAIKHFTSQRQKLVTEFFKGLPYRLLCTATPAPNDFIELGTSSEALGRMGRMDMLATYFKNDENSLHPIWWGSKWRIKRHAEQSFWRWVCSWARACRKPSDLGFPDGDFVLPPLEIDQTVVDISDRVYEGFFPKLARTLEEQRAERRLTIEVRCEKVVEVLNGERPAIAWCHLNREGDLLEKILPNAVQVQGSDPDEVKEERFLAFSDGQIPILVTKPQIGGFGMNWQHCSDMTFFPSHSFERYYQSVRRCWRFGQKKKVHVQIITTPSEVGVLRNLQRKANAAEEMFDNLLREMNQALAHKKTEEKVKVRLPQWLVQ